MASGVPNSVLSGSNAQIHFLEKKIDLQLTP